MGNTLGGATCNLTCTSYTGCEFSRKVVRRPRPIKQWRRQTRGVGCVRTPCHEGA